MADYIPIDQTKAWGSRLRNVLENARTVRAELAIIKAAMLEMIDGANYAEVETRFGIATGLGDDTYNLTAGAESKVRTDADIQQWIDRLGPQ